MIEITLPPALPRAPADESFAGQVGRGMVNLTACSLASLPQTGKIIFETVSALHFPL